MCVAGRATAFSSVFCSCSQDERTRFRNCHNCGALHASHTKRCIARVCPFKFCKRRCLRWRGAVAGSSCHLSVGDVDSIRRTAEATCAHLRDSEHSCAPGGHGHDHDRHTHTHLHTKKMSWWAAQAVETRCSSRYLLGAKDIVDVAQVERVRAVTVHSDHSGGLELSQ